MIKNVQNKVQLPDDLSKAISLSKEKVRVLNDQEIELIKNIKILGKKNAELTLNNEKLLKTKEELEKESEKINKKIELLKDENLLEESKLIGLKDKYQELLKKINKINEDCDKKIQICNNFFDKKRLEEKDIDNKYKLLKEEETLFGSKKNQVIEILKLIK